MKKPRILIVALAVTILCVTIGLYWYSSKPGGIEPKENDLWVEVTYRDNLWGRAVVFTTTSGAPFFSFLLEKDNRTSYKVEGYHSPAFADFQVDWESEPLVCVAGDMVDDNTVFASSVEVKVDDQMRNWYEFCPGPTPGVLWHPIGYFSEHLGDRVWFGGDYFPYNSIRTENALATPLWVSGGIFEIPENIPREKVIFWGVLRYSGNVGGEH
ncbi:MAG: hypothetical protein U9M97_05365 [Candidatus Hadarchaeota archaeon]|nr:hypothetical protein [Candidatus Hadarchaeota archaeon]